MLVPLLVAGLPLAGLLAYASSRPDSFRIERSAVISAPAQEIFAVLQNLRRSGECTTRSPSWAS